MLRNFDMRLILKDYTKNPHDILSIESKHLDTLKNWLNECDLVYAESAVNLNWPNIMKSIRQDPASFIAKGGWEWAHDDAY